MKKFTIPEHLQLEMLADCAGISDQQQQVVRLATENLLTLEMMCAALIQEYPLMHEKDAAKKRDTLPNGSKRYGSTRACVRGNGRFQQRNKYPSFRAHLAVPDSASADRAENDDSET